MSMECCGPQSTARRAGRAGRQGGWAHCCTCARLLSSWWGVIWARQVRGAHQRPHQLDALHNALNRRHWPRQNHLLSHHERP